MQKDKLFGMLCVPLTILLKHEFIRYPEYGEHQLLSFVNVDADLPRQLSTWTRLILLCLLTPSVST